MAKSKHTSVHNKLIIFNVNKLIFLNLFNLKIATTGCYSVCREYVKCILEVFGEDLKNLFLWGRREDKFNLADLAPCSNLESLFLSSCTLEEEEDVAALDAATFLPNLKSFTSDSCLGSRSCYFEEKSSLIKLKLNCSHVGLDIKKGRLMYAKVRKRQYPRS